MLRTVADSLEQLSVCSGEKAKKGLKQKKKIGKRSEPRLSYPVDVNLELRHYVKQMIESSESFNSEFLTFVLHVFL